MISKELLDILACPKCKEAVAYDKKKHVLVCAKCKLRYRIDKDIPNFLDAEKL
jgi:uncharacterized protein YbaR (Trm112 family)